MDTPSVPLKRCNRQDQCLHPDADNGWLPATPDYFYKNNRAKDKLFNSCKVCTLAMNKAWREANPTYFNEYDALRREEHNHRARVHRLLNRDDLRQRERDRYIRRADDQRSKARRRRATEHGRAVVARYRQRADVLDRYRIHAANRRARERGLPCTMTDEQWELCLDYFNGLCAICGHGTDENTIIAADHWIPVTDPRPDNPGTVATNIIPLCHPTRVGGGSCNLSKADKDPVQWIIQQYGPDKTEGIVDRIESYLQWVRAIDDPV